jgi:alpha-mannosidase
MHITSVTPTELFVATAEGEAQVLLVSLDDPHPGSTMTVVHDGTVVGSSEVRQPSVEVPLTGLIGRAAGETVEVQVSVGDETESVQVPLAEPGWTVWMIPHFHYDPVWWNTQAAYTATWDDLGEEAQRTRAAFQQTGFTLVRAHLAVARRDPDYRFVLAEVDYLKPYWDAHPGDRTYLRRLIDEGRVEIMGGTYNEPNTNLTTAETTARNFVYGAGFQRSVLGADPHTAWQLDVFGHDPQFPGMAAEAGLTSSSWARGPHHQWGPMLTTHDYNAGWGDPSVMQFPAEFEWISPSGRGVLTHYMPAHYSAGWSIDSCSTLADAERAVYELFLLLKKVAATRNVLLPVGTDYTPPSKWVTEIHRDWNSRYAWPRFECAVPKQFFAAVRRELDGSGRRAAPQTRDMNPVYTGKDVSYIDTKQAQREAESLLVDAEMFASFATLHGAQYPHEALDKAWRQLVYGAHHDAITGSESDQVYLDLLTSWREAHDIGRDVLQAALDHLTGRVEASAADTAVPVAVFNPSAWDRADLVTVRLDELPATARALEVADPGGRVVPSVVENAVTRGDGTLAAAEVSFVAAVPGVGHRAGWQVRATPDADPAGWEPLPGDAVESDRYVVEVDPQRGGCIRRLFDKQAQREVLRAGGLGNELVLGQEYSEHPEFHEGPWHLVPTGRSEGSAGAPAGSVVAERSALGQRITVTGTLAGIAYTQRITLWDGLDRVDCRTTLDGFEGVDQLVRVRWAADVPGALPVSEVGNAVVGRGFAFPDSDAATHPWTLDNPAGAWFALSSTARVRVLPPDGGALDAHERAIGIAELVAADPVGAAELRELAVALAGQGVTATTSVGSGARYGRLAVDSNLPDVRISVGGPDENAFTAAVLDAADDQYRVELDKQLAANGAARIWVPAARSLQQVWQPSADLSGPGDLPVLIVVGRAELDALVEDLADAVIEVSQLADATTEGEASLADYTVALLNTGMPSFAVDSRGTMHLSVLRSCTGWPSGVWIDPPRRTAPDGSNFQQQHWTHCFDYALVSGSGDWRAAGLVRAGHALNHRLRTSTARPAAPELPAHLRYLTVDSPTEVVVAAVKASGNPLAEGREPGPVDSLTLRLVEARGGAAPAAVSTSFPISAAGCADLLERPDDGPGVRLEGDRLVADLTPMQIRTVRIGVSGQEGTARLGARGEPHQPVYTRYWLNNTGPAPAGNLPVSVHVDPQVIDEPVGAEGIELTVRVASDRTDAAVDVPLRLVLPDGWSADREEFVSAVPPGEFVEHTVRVSPPTQPQDGTAWLRVQAEVGEQTIEDVARVLVGTVPPELTVSVTGPQPLEAGEHGAVEVDLISAANSGMSVQVQLISPWHTWELIPIWNSGAALAPGGRQTVSFPVEVPVGAASGTWWALVKVGAAGRLHYSEPVVLEVRG